MKWLLVCAWIAVFYTTVGKSRLFHLQLLATKFCITMIINFCLSANASAEEIKVRTRRAPCGNRGYHEPQKDSGTVPCGSLNYNCRTHVCCLGNILPERKGRHCCGSLNYNRRTDVSCLGKILSRRGGPYCCGNKNYRPCQHSCCKGYIIKKQC